MEKNIWVAILNDTIRKEHPDALQAIIMTGACKDIDAARMIAKNLGLDFRP